VSEAGKPFIKRQIIGVARRLMRTALAITSPTVFLRLVNEQLPASALRTRLLNGGLDEFAEVLTRIAKEEKLPFAETPALAIASPEGFLKVVGDQLGQPALRPVLVEGGLERLRLTLNSIALEDDLAFAHLQDCYSQEGEDLFLYRLFAEQPEGFYVDIGALHPVRFSNTYLLYKKGWSGINIDATPGSMAKFNRLRPRDINVECMISSDTTPQTYFQFKEPALNTMSEDMARKREAEGFPVVAKTLLHPKPLSAILEAHIPAGKTIDVMSVDVEGMDLEVLASNDWQRFRPRLVIAELLETKLEAIAGSDIYAFLAGRGYVLVSKLFNSAVFMARDGGAAPP
jgi:hypothetical protein